MKNQKTLKEVIKPFVFAFLLLFFILFWQLLTVSDAEIEISTIEFLSKYLEKQDTTTIK